MSETTRADIIVGVDTHKHVHAAVAIDGLGARLGTMTIPVSEKGYRTLEAWARSLGPIRAFGIEGTGSYGAGLSRFLGEQGHAVLEVNRPNRQLRHQKGKSDPLDAESAARAVLSKQATALPKSGTSAVEMIRHLKVARGTAIKGRTQAMLTLKAIIVSAPAALREQLDRLTGKMTLIRRLAALRPGSITSTTASAKASLRAIARRWLALDEEIKGHDAHLEMLTTARAPELVQAHGMGVGTAAAMLLLVGDNPERIRSEAAFAKLCGACPIPASSGKTTRHRLNRGGNRQANAALHRVVVTRMRGHQPTLGYVRRRTGEGKAKAEIIRCLKRFVAREIFGYLCAAPKPANPPPKPLDPHRSINAPSAFGRSHGVMSAKLTGESFFASLKKERVHQARFRTRTEARAAVFDYVEVFYNRQRLHSGIGYRTPAEARASMGGVTMLAAA